MKKSADINNEKTDMDENMENKSAQMNEEQDEMVEEAAEATEDEVEKLIDSDLAVLKDQLDNKAKQCEEYYNMLQRLAAEFDNYKKRTAKEKEALYSEAVGDVITAILPVADSIERALAACGSDSTKESVSEGIELVGKQIAKAMDTLEVKEICSVGEGFDPQLHNAVMHVEDDSYGQNVVIEEFQKGYTYKGKVIRHSMVKVAN